MHPACTYAALLALTAAACRDRPASSSASVSARETVVVYLAASLTKPLQAALDTFAARNNSVVQRESGGSLEHARKLTELGRIPDVIALADPEVFPQLLMPKHVTWYADFARNRMIIGYTDKSRHAAEIDSMNWPRILAEKGVEVGRPDPRVAPAGYRTFLMLELAEKYYHDPGLMQRVLANADPTKVRPNAAELAALLQTGEVDYVFDYESVAAVYGFHALRLPAAIDLGDPARANEYAQVKFRDNPDSVIHTGSPILYALSVPVKAPHPAAAARLAGFLLSAEGRSMMRAAHVDALDHAVFVGTDAPVAIRDAASR
ncbi:MAG TPA: extracellular solute-binding protein [Gemmatimonadaceae bacterium]|nr:extracellular solute-binding protein [Gemmatimonadaceae bacterium]